MTLDDLKLALNDLSRSLDADAAPKTVDPGVSLRRSRSALAVLRVALRLEAAQAVVFIALLAWFLAIHAASSWPSLASAGLLLTLETLYLGATVRQQALVRRIDYAEPVVRVQQQLGTLMALRSRTVWAVLVTAPLVWLPLLIVAAEWFVGVDVVGATSWAWVLANLGFGLAVLGVGLWVARHPPRWVRRSPRLRQVFDHLAGRSLRRALDHVAEAAAFERNADA